MFLNGSDDGYLDALPGIRRKTLSYGDATLMSEFRLRAGYPLPIHDHPQEQTGYLVSGRLRLTIGDETHEVVARRQLVDPGRRAARRGGARGRRRGRGLLAGARGLPALTSRVCRAASREPRGRLESTQVREDRHE